MAATTLIRLFAIATAILSFHLSSAQAQLPAPSPASAACNGIYLTYTYNGGSQIPPTVPRNQPYSFKSTLTVLNNGARELKSWRVFVGFRHGEYLVSASNAVLADGNSIPGYVNGTVFAGYPATDLKTAIETAGDLNQMSARVDLVGTQFGVDLNSSVPMPSNISLANDGFRCPTSTFQGRSQMHVCCVEDPNATTNITVIGEFLPRQDGDLTIMYDVIRTYDTSYWAQVTISNHNPLGRLDNWNLTWDWMREEFINSMRGAYPYVRDSSECIFGSQGQHYKGVDFANVLNCERSPTIIDLPLTKANDTTLGLIPFCCRNGTILPPIMDPSQSISSFQVEVYKMPPDLNRSQLNPPQNFKISGRLGPDYHCGPPVRVSPSQFPDPNGLPSEVSAVASWQVVCNITVPKNTSPKCCVSFSAYYNESIIPCPTCACGCPTSTSTRACSAAAPALFLPSQALLVPFDNRTTLATAWANIQHRTIPNPLPCGDNCGVSINWHLLTDYRGGWTSRITVFNWDDSSFADWFVAVEMDKASAGFEKAYSFNSTTLGVNNTIFMQGLPGINYLVGETNGADPAKDPRVPGKQQSVLSFTKKLTPGIDVVGGDGFPTRVLFNGEECALPRVLPTNNSHKKNLGLMFSFMLSIVVLMLMLH